MTNHEILICLNTMCKILNKVQITQTQLDLLSKTQFIRMPKSGI